MSTDDLSEPARPPECPYRLWFGENRTALAKELGSDKLHDVAILGWQRWQSLSDADKERFQSKVAGPQRECPETKAALDTVGGVKRKRGRPKQAAKDRPEGGEASGIRRKGRPEGGEASGFRRADQAGQAAVCLLDVAV